MDWDGLFESHADDVVRVCWRILGRRADVEDCVQDTFVQAFELQRRESVRNWPGLLRRIAVMNSLRMLRRRRSRLKDELVADGREPARNELTPDEVAMRRELENRLRQEVGRLPDQEAAAFCMRYFEAMSVPETARALGVSAGAVSAALHRARRKLEQRLSDVLSTSFVE